MSARPSHARETLREALQAGIQGGYRALADYGGLSVHQARATLKELRRAGEADASPGETTGRRGRAPAVYSRRIEPLDALAHVRLVWR